MRRTSRCLKSILLVILAAKEKENILMVEKIKTDFDPIERLPLDILHKVRSDEMRQSPSELSQDKELTARIDETFFKSVDGLNSIAYALGDDSSLTAFNRVVTKGESPSLEFLDSYAQPKEKTEEAAAAILQEKQKLNKPKDQSLALLFINLYVRYYEEVHIPRISSLIGSAHRKNDEIKDLNELIGHLNSATPDKKTGKISLSEQGELLARIGNQEGAPLLDKEGVWDSKEIADKQVEEIKARIQNLTQEVNTTLMDVSHEKETMNHLFEPTKNTLEKESGAIDNMLRRTGS